VTNHPHGTVGRYKGTRSQEGCRCRPCTDAAVHEDARRVLDRLAGRPRSVPSGPAWQHILLLRKAGLNDAAIARAAGIGTRTSIARLGQQPTTHRSTADKILSVGLDHRPTVTEHVPATGAIRRVRAMFRLGHSGQHIADRAGMDRQRINKLANAQQVTLRRDLDASIRRAYAELATTTGSNTKAINLAVRCGWHGPDAWDDDIDDPTATPGGLILGSRDAAKERLAEIHLLASAGAGPAEIAQRIGLAEETVRDRLRTKYPSLYLELTA
jgi:hypothetical protein